MTEIEKLQEWARGVSRRLAKLEAARAQTVDAQFDGDGSPAAPASVCDERCRVRCDSTGAIHGFRSGCGGWHSWDQSCIGPACDGTGPAHAAKPARPDDPTRCPFCERLFDPAPIVLTEEEREAVEWLDRRDVYRFSDGKNRVLLALLARLGAVLPDGGTK